MKAPAPPEQRSAAPPATLISLANPLMSGPETRCTPRATADMTPRVRLSLSVWETLFVALLVLVAAPAGPARGEQQEGVCAGLVSPQLAGRSADAVASGTATELVVGMMRRSKGLEEAVNFTVTTYLNDTAGPELGVTFKFIFMDRTTTELAVQHRCVDFAIVDEVTLTCLTLQYDMDPLMTFQRYDAVTGSVLNTNCGVFLAKADREDIQSIADIPGRILQATALTSMLGALLPQNAMAERGIDFYTDPLQVRYLGDVPSGMSKVVAEIKEGRADVGMIASGSWYNQVARGLIDPTELKILDPIYNPSFSIPYSTATCSPEWALVPLPHVPQSVVFTVAKHLSAIEVGSYPASEVANTTWAPASNYVTTYRLMTNAGIIRDGQCLEVTQAYDAIICPEGLWKVSRETYDKSCQILAEDDPMYACPDGFECICDPCTNLPEYEFLVTAKTANGDSMQCNKLETCATLMWNETLEITVVDQWFDLREQIGLPCVEQVVCVLLTVDRERHVFPDVDRGTQGAEGQSCLQKVFTSTLSSTDLGSHLLDVGALYSGGNAYRFIEETPNFIQVMDIECDEQLLMSNGNGTCVCINDPNKFLAADCLEAAGYPKWMYVAVLLPCLAVSILAAVAIRRVVHKDDHWILISEASIEFEDHDEELIGSHIGVRVGRFMGTKVVVKGAYSNAGQQDWSTRSSTRGGMLVHLETDDPADMCVVDGMVLKNVPYGREVPAVNVMPRPLHLVGVSGESPDRSRWSPQGMPTEPSKWATLTGSDTAIKMPLQAFVPGPPEVRLSGHQKKVLSKQFFADMKLVMKVRHPNISPPMGAVMDGSGSPLMVKEFMEHATLLDILRNNTVSLDSDITLQIIKDIASGMAYLHSMKNPIIHNNLKSGSILIDSNFRARITDFGLTYRRTCFGVLGTPYWMAPEILAGQAPTPKSDVYAMGMVLYEMFMRQDPYDGLDPWEVLQQVLDVDVFPSFRPELPQELPSSIRELIADCWCTDPDKRPTFIDIANRVEGWSLFGMQAYLRVRPSLGDGPRLLRTLSRKRITLENNILHKVFPVNVANALIRGEKIEPEHHDCVTIFFSDIVGFTDISRNLEAVDVMDLLDRLYVEFDNLSEKHGLFKVETIGDAYMAVANLAMPQPNHAELIALFSLDAIKAANAIPVKTNDPSYGNVNIRVGFHSGHVVASVVGTLNPRYCLFGDTVNTSSRMESSSEAGRIHCSTRAAEELKDVSSDDFHLVTRGKVHIKGKGDMLTYWVERGPESSVKNVPLPGQAAS